MCHYKTRIIQTCIAAAMIVLTTGASLACGNAMLYPLLFRAYPQTKVVFDAEMDARRQGQLSVPAWSRDLGPTYHQWSLARAGQSTGNAFSPPMSRRHTPGPAMPEI